MIVKLSSLGDIIHTLPVAGALRTLYPRAQLTWLVNSSYRGLLDDCPDINDAVYFDRDYRKGLFRFLASFVRLIRKIRREKYDLVIDLQGLFRSGMISWLAGGRKVLGLDNAREGSRWFYQVRVPVPGTGPVHAVDRYLLVPKQLGWTGTPEFKIRVQPADEQFIERFLKAEKARTYLPLIGIHPVARWRTKLWPAENFARLADLISDTEQFQVVFLGSDEDQNSVIQIIRMMKSSPVIATGKFSLKQLAAFLKRSRLLITTDSGPMHIAAALNIPLLALFGATDEKKTGPYQMEKDVISRHIPCRPCLKRVCMNSSWPMECMARITPEEAFEQFKSRVHF